MLGDVTPSAWIPATAGTAQAGLAVGVAGDLDGDGLHDVLLGEAFADDGEGRLVAWSPMRPEAPLAAVTLPASDAGLVLPSETPGPDLDGDGREEIVVALTTSLPSRLYVFAGTLAGEAGVDDAFLSVDDPSGHGYRPVSAGDLDGDGVGDLLFVAPAGGRGGVRLLPGALAGGGGVLDVDDIAPLFDRGFFPPVLFDIDDDGLPEMFAPEQGHEGYRVYGFAGAAVASAARSEATLAARDALVRLDGGASDYFGRQLAPVTDLDCAPGLAVSAQLAERVSLFSNAQLRDGGAVPATDARSLAGPGGWFGYVLAGGRDLDVDGSLDLVAGNAGGDLALYLSPATLAVPP